MSPKKYPGEFEFMVLLAILQCDTSAFALEIREEIERSAERRVSRGSVYTTLDRLEKKGLISWVHEVPAVARAGPTHHRLYRLTPDGLEAVQDARRALVRLWRGLDGMLDAV